MTEPFLPVDFRMALVDNIPDHCYCPHIPVVLQVEVPRAGQHSVDGECTVPSVQSPQTDSFREMELKMAAAALPAGIDTVVLLDHDK